jgi:hypothetical protein
MGADKNSSPKRELGLCPKFTTKESHTSLPRSSSHNEPTNPRNKPQTIPKRKHDSRSKGLSSSARHQAESAVTWQTVRGSRTDSSKNKPTLQQRTSNNEQFAPYPRTVREQPVPRGRSATSRRTVRQTPPGQKQLAKQIERRTLKN